MLNIQINLKDDENEVFILLGRHEVADETVSNEINVVFHKINLYVTPANFEEGKDVSVVISIENLFGNEVHKVIWPVDFDGTEVFKIAVRDEGDATGNVQIIPRVDGIWDWPGIDLNGETV